eukprot:SM000111S18802  [mRNA]  locus=s111:248307:249843:- [translate_table: standard]
MAAARIDVGLRRRRRRRRRLWRPQDQYGSIDLSDNEISKLEGFPLLRRLNTLLLNNNRVMRISPALGASLPALHTLVLTGNRLQNLADLDGLAALGSLRALSLLDNVVAKKPNYRLYVLHKLPSLRLLDFRKVKQAELAEAKKVFGSKEAEAAAKKASANTFVPGEGLDDLAGAEEEEPAAPKGPTPEQLIAIKAAIATAQTFEEVERLEKARALKAADGTTVTVRGADLVEALGVSICLVLWQALVTGVLPSDLKLPGDEIMREAGAATEGDAPADVEDPNRTMGRHRLPSRTASRRLGPPASLRHPWNRIDEVGPWLTYIRRATAWMASTICFWRPLGGDTLFLHFMASQRWQVGRRCPPQEQQGCAPRLAVA